MLSAILITGSNFTISIVKCSRSVNSGNITRYQSSSNLPRNTSPAVETVNFDDITLQNKNSNINNNMVPEKLQ